MAIEKQRQVLVVLPHPDDESGVSGTIAWHIVNGTPVTYVCLTLGEMGRSMGNPIIANRVSLPAIRTKELEESCRSIGITDVRKWGIHDKTVEFEDQDMLDRRLSETIAELNPSLIITFYPGYSVHPDHDATGAVVVRTVGRMPADKRPAVHCIAFSKNCESFIGPPNLIHDVTSVLDRKIGSYKAHRSQFQFPTGDKVTKDQEHMTRLSTERYWVYKFAD